MKAGVAEVEFSSRVDAAAFVPPEWFGRELTGEPGQSNAALREVREETGLRCSAGEELPEVRYTDGQGRARRVRFWAMQSMRGEFRPNDEVDEFRWASLELAGELLTSERDLVVVSGLRLVHATIS